MKIQKINNYNNIAFQRDKKEHKTEKQRFYLSCDIDEHEKNGRKQICFRFDKDELAAFFASFVSKINFFNKDKDKTLDIDINPSLNSEDKNSAIIITPEKVEPAIQKPVFPTPKFTSNPTIQQRDEYVSELLEYMNTTPDTKLQLKALKEIEKYGIKDVDDITNGLDSIDESVIRQTLRIYQKYGTDKDAYIVIEPIVIKKIKIKEEETFIEVLKTIQKLAHLENDTPQDREIILRPVRRLLNHENENIRKMAQETLDKITPKD